MTATLSPLTIDNVTQFGDMYCIFPGSESESVATFDVDQLCDIANHGMSQGVSGFIYTRDCVEWFDENEDMIEEYLSDWYFDNLNERNYLAAICNDTEPCSIDELKTKMVWSYVELRAHDILCNIKHPDFY